MDVLQEKYNELDFQIISTSLNNEKCIIESKINEYSGNLITLNSFTVSFERIKHKQEEIDKIESNITKSFIDIKNSLYSLNITDASFDNYDFKQMLSLMEPLHSSHIIIYEETSKSLTELNSKKVIISKELELKNKKFEELSQNLIGILLYCHFFRVR